MIDVKQYIESGILEDYLSGTLSETERKDVESTVDKYPEIAQELASMSMSLSMMADIGAVQPASYMEDRIWNEILATNFDEDESNADIIKPEVPKTSKLPYIMSIALAIIAFVSIYFIIIANGKLDRANEKIANIEQANKELQTEFDQLKYNYDSLVSISNIYNLDNTSIVVMKPNRRNTINSLVVIVWDKLNNKIYLDVKRLPNSETGKKYFLWGITQIGRQINLGSFIHNGSNQTVELTGIRDAVRYILTQEKESGVSYPTMSKVYTTADVY